MPTGPVFENNNIGIVNTNRNISQLVTLGDNLVKFHQEFQEDRALAISFAHDSIMQQNRDISNVFAVIGGIPLSVSVGYDADLNPSGGDNVGNFYALDVIVSNEVEDARYYNSLDEKPQVNGIQMGVAKKEGLYYLKTYQISNIALPDARSLINFGGIPMALGKQNELIVRDSGYTTADVNRYQELMFFGSPIRVGMVDAENKYFLIISPREESLSLPFSDPFNNSSLHPYWNWADNDLEVGTVFSEGSGMAITAGGRSYFDPDDDYAAIYLTGIEGNWSATVKINSFTDVGNSWSKTGLVVRDDLSTRASAGGYAAMLTGSDVASEYRIFQYDNTDNGILDSYITSNSQPLTSFPQWIKITRVGSMIRGYYSTDGVTYTVPSGIGGGNAFKDFGANISSSVDVGMVVSSQHFDAGTKLVTTVFSDFSIETL